MAEIRVERQKTPIWPWILGALALVVVAFIFFANRDDHVDTAAVTPTANTVVTAPVAATAGVDTMAASVAGASAATATAATATTPSGAVAQFIATVQSTPDAGMNHEYTAAGLRQLADAIQQVAGPGVANLDGRLQEIRTEADRIQRDPTSLKHANEVRHAFDIATGLMAEMQHTHANITSDQVQRMNAATHNLTSGQPLLDQVNTVHDFFTASADALQGTQS